MILLKLILAIVGVVVIAVALFFFFTELTGELGAFGGIVSAIPVLLIFLNESVSEFFGLSDDLIFYIALLAMVGGGFICAMDFEKLGGAMITAGWIAVGLILMQVVPIAAISSFIQVVAVPFIVAMVPLMLFLMMFM